MNKAKLFIENILVYGLGGVISKIIPLIMVPVVTRIIPETSYYGLSDLSGTVISFASALAVLGMYDAMYRLFFEKEDEDYQRKVCSTAVLFNLFSSFVVFCLMLLFKESLSRIFFADNTYSYLITVAAFSTVIGSTNLMVSAPTRMQNKRKIFLAVNLISPVLAYSLCIPLLLKGFYILALPVSGMAASLIVEIAFLFLNHKWFRPSLFDWGILKQLLAIAIPVFPSFLFYWIFNSLDKIMIANMMGAGEAGIYAVASKLGHCSQLIYTAFTGGWQYFAFSTMKEKNQVKSNSMVFEYLGMISFIATAFICAWSSLIFRELFKNEYYSGFVSAPYLFLAPLLLMLYQVIGNQLLVIKKTWPSLIILSSGAVINVVLNYYLIPALGIEGASIATLSGYVVTVMVCVVTLLKMNLFVISRRFIAAVIMEALYIILWRFWFSENTVLGTGMAVVLTLLLAMLYKTEIKTVFRRLKKDAGH